MPFACIGHTPDMRVVAHWRKTLPLFVPILALTSHLASIFLCEKSCQRLLDRHFSKLSWMHQLGLDSSRRVPEARVQSLGHGC